MDPLTTDRKASHPHRRVVLAAVLALLLLGLVERTVFLSLAPRWGYAWDHFDNIGMGVIADHFGLTKAYAVPVTQNPVLRGKTYSPRAGQWQDLERQVPRVSNYPPIGLALFYLQAKSLFAVAPRVEINTFFSRLWMALLPVLAELILAAGMYLLGFQLAGRRAGAGAAAVCWLFPPLVMDSCFWGQTDAWFLAPALFMIYLLVRQRWVAAGLVWGLAIALKPQGVLLAPVALFAAAVTPRAGPSRFLAGSATRLVKILVAAGGALGLLTLPWTLSDGLSWYRESFTASLQMYARTTMGAFNIWYLDLLAHDTNPFFDMMKSTVLLASLSKDAWGRALLLAALSAAAWLCGRKYRSRPALAVTLFSALWFWSVFLFPTRVHERYIVYCMPPMILAATALKRLWPAVVFLAVLGAVEMNHDVWPGYPAAGEYMREPAELFHREMLRRYEEGSRNLPPGATGSPPTFEESSAIYRERYLRNRAPKRPLEYLATAASLLTFAWAGVVVCRGRASPEKQSGSDHRSGGKRARQPGGST